MALAQLGDDVVRRAQRGDRDAFELLVRTYQGPVFNHMFRLVRDRGLAEDLTQDVFSRVFQKLPGFSFRSKFTTWLFEIASNRVVDEMRARERRPHPCELPADDLLRVPDRGQEHAETIDAIWLAVGALTIDLKTALLLRDVTGLTYDEIAETLQITLATVKWRIYKAREEVQRALSREGIVVTTARMRAARGRRRADAAALPGPSTAADGPSWARLDSNQGPTDYET
jgi:RNA polymerase sigma-70 factor, ECF subfamily